MPKQTFTINDFSGGANGYVDPLDIADNELAQCQGFKPEPGTVIVLGDMKGAYTPAADSSGARIEPGYGLFAFAHDYNHNGVLGQTEYLVLMDNTLFDVYSTSEGDWVNNGLTMGTSASDNSFAGSVKPCFFVAEGALRVSPGNHEAKDSVGGMGASFAATPVYGATEAVTATSDLTDYISAGDTIVINGQEMVALIVAATTLTAARNMTGTFPSITAHATDDTVNVVLETRWYGVVKRRNFPQAGDAGTFTEWYASYAHPRPPVTWHADLDAGTVSTQYTMPFLVGSSAIAADAIVTGAQPPMLWIVYKADNTDADATWDSASINIYCTALYDEVKQESQPNKIASAVSVAAANTLGVGIVVNYADAGVSSGAYQFNKRVTGARVYYEDTTGDPGIFYQLLEIDFEKGVKKAGAEAFTSWADHGSLDDELVLCPTTNSYQQAALDDSTNAFMFTAPPKAFTYEFNTGYPADIDTHARYKTAVVAGGRLFTGNIYQSGRAHGDLMIGSPVHKYDTLPRTEPYATRVAAGDGDEIIKLEAYADRILQFKKRALYIVNISGGLGEEFPESEHKNMGVENPSQTCMTEYGVAWVNSHGVFLYDGQEITDLTLNKLQMTNTTDRARALNITESNIPLIGYHPDNKWLVVHPESTITDNFDVEAWIHDFKNGSWTYSQEFTATNERKTNMVWAADNNLVFGAGTGGEAPNFFKYRDSSANITSGNLLLLTKEFHLNAPGVKKKLRSIYITYSAAANTKIEADIIYKHVTGATTTEESLEEANSGSTFYTNANGFLSTGGSLAAPNIRTVELVPATPVTNAYTFQLKLHAPDAAYEYTSYFKLYNVSFVYRPLGVR